MNYRTLKFLKFPLLLSKFVLKLMQILSDLYHTDCSGENMNGNVYFCCILFHLCTCIFCLMMVEWNDRNMTCQNDNKRSYNVRVLCLCGLDC